MSSDAEPSVSPRDVELSEPQSEGPPPYLCTDPSPTGGRRGKRDADNAPEGESEGVKEPRIEGMEPRDSAQLRLLAMVPSMGGPLRDARGRRRAISLSTSQLVEAGLASLVQEEASVREREPRSSVPSVT